MAKVRGTSSAPMVVGLIGGIMGLPAAVCSGACAAGFSSVVEENQAVVNTVGNAYMTIGLIAAVIAIIFSCLTKKTPYVAGAMLLVSAVLFGITLITFNVLSLIALILVLIAGCLSLGQKKEAIE